MGLKLPLSLLFLASVLSYSVAQTVIATTPPFVAQQYVPNITRPRSLILDLAGDMLVTSATQSRVTAIRETNHGNGTATVATRVIVDGAGLGLNHGIAFFGGFLYASNPTTVFRWPYTPGQWSLINQNTRQTVIQGIPSVQGHSTRTLEFDRQGRLYIAIGTQTNANPSPHRSRILRFNNLGNQFLPIPFGNGEVYADGCRNTVGLGFNLNDELYSVDMGADMLNRPDVGAIWGDNPGDEMNRHPPTATNRHYGFPDCWSVYRLSGHAQSSQFAWPFAGVNLAAMDNWCRNPNNNVAPVLSFPAHASPMSIDFYSGANCGVGGGFPCAATNEPFVTFRGSWHPGVPHGYKVTWYRFNNAGNPTGEAIDVLFSPVAVNSCNSCLRPAGAAFNRAGHLIVSGDTTHQLFRVAHNTVLPTIINVTT